MMSTSPHRIFTSAVSGIACLFTLSAAFAADPQDAESAIPQEIKVILENNCYDCHDDITQKGDIRLDRLAVMPLDHGLELLNRMQKQVYTKEMPPRDEKYQPTDQERDQLFSWISGILEKHNAAKFEDELKKPGYGNYVDHDKLFSGEYKHLPGFTYDRKWLVSEYIFTEKINEITAHSPMHVKINKQKHLLRGRAGAPEIVNPFLLPKITGVRYFANEELTSGHFLTMVGNTEYIANHMIGELRKRNKHYLPAVAKLTEMSDKHKAILNTRRNFLRDYIDDVCAEASGGQHESLLPAYTQIPLSGGINQKRNRFGRHGWRNRIGAADGEAIKFVLKKFEQKSSSNEDLIRKCERFWFHFGEDQGTIERRVKTLQQELVSIFGYRFYKKWEEVKYQPLNPSEMKIIISTIKKYRTKGMTYNKLIAKCMGHWSQELRKIRESTDVLTDDLVTALLNQLYEVIYERSPTTEETRGQSQLLRTYAARHGVDAAIRKLTQTLLLSTEFVSRNEYGVGQADQHGRRMLSPRDASYAIAYALTDSSPDKALVKAAREGKLQTREDYKREVLRMLNDKSRYYIVDDVVHGGNIESITNTPIRKLRFFREFFGYPRAFDIFKDEKRFGAPGAEPHLHRLIAEADLLIDHILEKDKNVIEELLTTEDFYVYHNGDNARMKAYAESLRKIYDYFKDKNWKNIKSYDELMQHKKFIDSMDVLRIKTNAKRGQKTNLNRFKRIMTEITSGFSGGAKYTAPFISLNDRHIKSFPHGQYGIFRYNSMRGEDVSLYFNLERKNWDYSPQQPAPISNRKGMLTHPAWLIAHAQNFQTDPVIRGKWIREKLLAGSVPDVPITVDAVIPDDHTRTLRDRLHEKTKASECWKCHVRMNPLGNTFEIYDDFGRYRTEEELEHPSNVINQDEYKRASKHEKRYFRLRYKTLPVDATGVLDGTGNSQLDGEVKDAFELIDRLAKSDKVRQSVIRHAFRYFMGRNEMLSDSKTLIDADEAYLKSGGSFDAVIVSLLTSDSFIYRKPNNN